jgi:hypothetical protein
VSLLSLCWALFVIGLVLLGVVVVISVGPWWLAVWVCACLASGISIELRRR